MTIYIYISKKYGPLLWCYIHVEISTTRTVENTKNEQNFCRAISLSKIKYALISLFIWKSIRSLLSETTFTIGIDWVYVFLWTLKVSSWFHFYFRSIVLSLYSKPHSVSHRLTKSVAIIGSSTNVLLFLRSYTWYFKKDQVTSEGAQDA